MNVLRSHELPKKPKHLSDRSKFGGFLLATTLVTGCGAPQSQSDPIPTAANCSLQNIFVGPGPNIAFNVIVSGGAGDVTSSVVWGDGTHDDQNMVTAFQHTYDQPGQFDLTVSATTSDTAAPLDCGKRIVISTGESIKLKK